MKCLAHPVRRGQLADYYGHIGVMLLRRPDITAGQIARFFEFIEDSDMHWVLEAVALDPQIAPYIRRRAFFSSLANARPGMWPTMYEGCDWTQEMAPAVKEIEWDLALQLAEALAGSGQNLEAVVASILDDSLTETAGSSQVTPKRLTSRARNSTVSA